LRRASLAPHGQLEKEGSMTSHLRLAAFAATAALAIAAAGCGSDDSSSGSSGSKSSSGKVTGAGSTFAAPLYDQLGSEFKDKDGTSINYQSVGSGAGVAQFIANTVDYGATDVALLDDEVSQAKKKGDPLNIPIAFGAVTVSYNLPDVKKGLKLDGPTVAKIYLGQIKKWNDPAIASQNPGVKLPATDVTVVHRSDGSGTTGLFTEFLSDYSPEWKSKVGSDKEVKWPTGTGSKGNEGVAATVKQTEGAIGYVELAYALQNKFTAASVKNKSGKYIEPTLESTSAAGDGITLPDDLRFSAINSPGAAAYPIASATFAVVYKDMCKAGKQDGEAKSTQSWLNYLLGDGQSTMKEIQYASLPSDMAEKAKSMVSSMQCNGQAIGSS
jgi:phosphate transport system substrate-binding protein